MRKEREMRRKKGNDHTKRLQCDVKVISDEMRLELATQLTRLGLDFGL